MYKCKYEQISVVDILTYILLTILLFIGGSKMEWIGINTRSRTKQKGKKVKCVGKTRVCMLKWNTYWTNFCAFSLVIKKIKKWVKIDFFLSNERHVEILFPKKEIHFHFSEENYLNYTQKKWTNKGKQEQTLDPLLSP